MSDENKNEINNDDKVKEELDLIIPEEELSEDKYKINQNEESNFMTDKIIQLLQEKLLGQIDKFNIDLIKKYDTENMFNKEILDELEDDMENFKQSYIEQQFKIIKDILSKYNLIENLKNLSEEKNFVEELKSYDISIDIFSFIGPLTEKIKEIKKRENENNKELNFEKVCYPIVEDLKNFIKEQPNIFRNHIEEITKNHNNDNDINETDLLPSLEIKNKIKINKTNSTSVDIYDKSKFTNNDINEGKVYYKKKLPYTFLIRNVKSKLYNKLEKED